MYTLLNIYPECTISRLKRVIWLIWTSHSTQNTPVSITKSFLFLWLGFVFQIWITLLKMNNLSNQLNSTVYMYVKKNKRWVRWNLKSTDNILFLPKKCQASLWNDIKTALVKHLPHSVNIHVYWQKSKQMFEYFHKLRHSVSTKDK